MLLCDYLSLGRSSVLSLSRSRPSLSAVVMFGDALYTSALGDISFANDLDVLVRRHPWTASMPASRILHTAGVLSDTIIPNQSVGHFRRVFGPKVDGMKNLRDGVHGSPLHHTVLFSSVSTKLGLSGQANYGSANEALSVLAQHDSAAGVFVSSIEWGGWSSVGMAASSTAVLRRLARSGLLAIAPDTGVRVLELLSNVKAHASVVVFNPFDWKAFSKAMPIAASAFYSEFAMSPEDLSTESGAIASLASVDVRGSGLTAPDAGQAAAPGRRGYGK